ncbi:MAG: hypothetical protein EON56_04270 [Alphaproteobacteria bacterium]|nr:MAG: hypothetical protein EON56_04270 [Alphaproteobacteria bacterium]
MTNRVQGTPWDAGRFHAWMEKHSDALERLQTARRLEVEAAVARILVHLMRSGMTHKDARAYLLRRFPYGAPNGPAWTPITVKAALKVLDCRAPQAAGEDA